METLHTKKVRLKRQGPNLVQISFRTGLDSDQEMHRPRILGEGSKMVGYSMNSSLAGVYTTTGKTSLMENLKHG